MKLSLKRAINMFDRTHDQDEPHLIVGKIAPNEFGVSIQGTPDERNQMIDEALKRIGPVGKA